MHHGRNDSDSWCNRHFVRQDASIENGLNLKSIQKPTSTNLSTEKWGLRFEFREAMVSENIMIIFTYTRSSYKPICLEIFVIMFNDLESSVIVAHAV